MGVNADADTNINSSHITLLRGGQAKMLMMDRSGVTNDIRGHLYNRWPPSHHMNIQEGKNWEKKSGYYADLRIQVQQKQASQKLKYFVKFIINIQSHETGFQSL